MGVLVRAVLLCFVGSVLGIAGNALSPHPARLGTPVQAAAESAGAACADPRASVARIAVDEAKPLCIACTAAFVDARSAKEYAAGHVTGAVHLAPGQAAAPLLPRLSAAPTVIVYDRDRAARRYRARHRGDGPAGGRRARRAPRRVHRIVGAGAPPRHRSALRLLRRRRARLLVDGGTRPRHAGGGGGGRTRTVTRAHERHEAGLRRFRTNAAIPRSVASA